MDALSSNRSKLFSISLAHLFNDSYINYIQTLLPFLVVAGLGVSKGAFLISAFTITSSILQPVFGYLVDQQNQRWMVYVGTLWMAVLISLIGVIEAYPFLLILAAFSGLGTAAFHPQASAMVAAISGEKKGFSQSVFVAAGNIGSALTPLVVVPFVLTYGLEATPLFALPGIFVAVLLWFNAPKIQLVTRLSPPPLLSVLRPVWAELTKIVVVVALRSLAYFGLIAFLPLYLQYNNIPLIIGGQMLFLLLFFGAIGGLIGGYLSDLFGRKVIIVGSLVISSPLFYIFLHSTGLLSYLVLALAGAALLASFSVTIVAAQEVISKNAAMASGLMLGFGVGIGGLGVGLVGLVAEHIGLAYAINSLIWLPLCAGLVGLTIVEQKSSLYTSVNS
jgi:FSR family fosmidomycin resistance protein-like MFS transporter